jgi:hypothetical protein
LLALLVSLAGYQMLLIHVFQSRPFALRLLAFFLEALSNRLW